MIFYHLYENFTVEGRLSPHIVGDPNQANRGVRIATIPIPLHTTRWYTADIKPDDMENLITGVKSNYGFGIGTLGGPTDFSMHISSKESGNISRRPKLTIVYDIPEYIEVIAPKNGVTLRPNDVCEIAWNTNTNTKYKIELLKSGSVVEVLAENVESSPYSWTVAKHVYLGGKDYSIQVSNQDISSSNSPVFEILVKSLLTVEGGTGSGFYSQGDSVLVNANNPDTYLYQFSEWTGSINFLVDAYSETTTATMPDTDITIASNWERTLIHIPGLIKSVAYFNKSGGWASPLYGEIHITMAPASHTATIDFDVFVDKSGSYVVKATHAFGSKKCDSLFIVMEEVSNNNNLMRGKINVTYGYDMVSKLISDTLFLPKGESAYRFNIEPFPLFDTTWQGLSPLSLRFISKNFNFELIDEGTVLTVENGSGDGLYSDGDVVSITAVTPSNGGNFSCWESKSSLLIADSKSETTTVIMGSGDCIVTAVYEGASIAVNSISSIVKPGLAIKLQNSNLKILLVGEVDRCDFDLKIFNIQGKLIYSENKNIIGSKTIIIPASNFSHGVYMVQGMYREKMLTKTIIFR